MDIGDVGPRHGEAVNYEWKWYYSASGFIIWLFLILAIVLPKANQNFCVLRIFIPIVIVLLLWPLFKWVVVVTSSEAKQWDLLLQSFVISLAVLWLLAKQIGTFNGVIRFFLSISVFAVVAGLGIISNYLGFLREAIILLAFPVCSGLILLLAMAAAGRLCKGQYLPKRFMLWLGLLILFGGILVVYVFLFIVILTNSSVLSGSELFKIILYGTTVGSIFGLCIYVLNLPFMILPFGDPFFRERFYACLRLKAMPEAPQKADIGRNNEQNPGTKMPEKGDST